MARLQPAAAGARVLVVNAGSSSVKLSLIGKGQEVLAERELEAARDRVDPDRLADALAAGGLGQADAVGHRIVHGGSRFAGPALIDGEVEAALRGLSEMAPLHQAKSLAALDALGAQLGHLPAIACFDTAFHAGMPAAAATYALPERWRRRWEVRRYGFHGLSHAWVARTAGGLAAGDGGVAGDGGAGAGDGADAPRIVSCHLGAGASLCAIADGRSVDTTMGFTPLEGLVMATRSGSVDPGLVLWLMERTALSEREIAAALEHESGLLGLAGTSDMREVLEGARAGRAACRLALDVYMHSLRAGIAAMAAALGGIDVLAFTGGVGERAAEVRRLAAEGLGFLGVAIDEAANVDGSGDRDLSSSGAAVRTVVMRAREDLEIDRQVRGVLADGGGRAARPGGGDAAQRGGREAGQPGGGEAGQAGGA